MEIIMKVKCSPSPGTASSPHSTLKIVDHHHQLQQHTYTNAGFKKSPSPYASNAHQSGGKYPITSTNTSCNDCSMDYCCNISSCCVATPSPHYSQHSPQPTLSSISGVAPLAPPPPYPYLERYTTNSPIHTVDEPEFVSIDDEKVKQYLIRLGQQKLEKQQQQREHLQQQQQDVEKPYQFRSQKEKKITHVISAPTSENAVKPVVYEIIELDDEDEREKLKQIKQQAELSLATKKLSSNDSINLANRHTKSLDISLIPKTSESEALKSNQELPTNRQYRSSRELNKNSSNHKIIAEIDLLESDEDDAYMKEDDDEDDDDEDDDDDDDDTLPLAAVSCELQCDEDDHDVTDIVCNSSTTASYNTNLSYPTNYATQQQRNIGIKYSKPLVDDVVIVGSHGNKNADDMLVRWEEFEGHRERVFFECFLCGKKVQSSYNLRRHMMIHTGERPFGCDLCERRFREFSDMKKHRRRHSHEPNYLCMVCHQHPPLDNDPTRCINCCTQSKNAVIMAAMKPATSADSAVEQSIRIKAEIAQSSPNKQHQQQTLPTITSVTSFNAAVIGSNTPTATANVGGNSNNNNNIVSTSNSEKSLNLIDNIPAVHRPGYNELGIITRKEFPCPLCNRAFGTRHNLKRHYMIHTGEKPFSCNKCRKPFREYSTLKKHMVTHVRERWYKCMRCPMKFRDFLKYTEHKETHGNDSDSEEQPMELYTKYNSMQSDSYIDSHDEDSGGEDWLECCECGQRFNEIDAYNEHLKEHDANNRIFQCYICKQQLKSLTELDHHIKRHHKDDITDSMDEDNEDKEDAIIA